MQLPKVQIIIPEIIPSTQMLIIKPLMELHQRGKLFLRVDLESSIGTKALDWADLVVFSRNVRPSTLHLLQFLGSKGIPYIYDLDDNFFDVPLQFHTGHLLQKPQYQKMFRSYISQAALVRVYSKVLLDQITSLTEKVKLVTGPIDWSLIQSPVKEYPDRIIKIVYATSRGQEDNLGKVFSSALEKIVRKYPEKVRVYFLGFNALNENRYANVYFRPFCSNYESYLRNFSAAGYDIGLAPLLNDNFHRSKSNVKYREYAACEVAGIYSNVDVYADWVIDEYTGLLVENTEKSWQYAIERLINDTELRLHIQHKAYAHVRQNFSLERFSNAWLKQIQNILLDPKIDAHFFLFQKPKTTFIENNVKEKLDPLTFRIKNIYRTEGLLGVLSRIRNRLEIQIYITKVKRKLK